MIDVDELMLIVDTPLLCASSSCSEKLVSARASVGDARQVVVQSLTEDQVGLVGVVEV